MTSPNPTPRSNQPQDVQKRNFIKGLTGALLGFITIFSALPFISYLIPATNEVGEDKFVKVPNFRDVPVGKPTKMTFEDMDRQAFITSKAVYDIWVVKHGPDKASVFSPLCTHLNCRYNWLNNEFACPCHGSIFGVDGKVLGGPAPRPLDTLPCKVMAGELYVNWQLYKAGIPEKIQA